ncbi:MAG: EAL domain-containing protein [Lachnospiraceae bacterium]|nr:EAL domain-containing protein [Lachnospiraceae bacterium]
MEAQGKGQKRFLHGSILVILFLLFILVLGKDVYATQNRHVKVAFFPMDGYHIQNVDGSHGGMDVEYLNALSEYVNWELEYVTCDSWEDALAKLEAQEVDIVGSAQYSQERAEKYQFADLSSGYTFGVIATTPGSNIAYEDFEQMRDITFGMVENYVRQSEFLQYMYDNGIEEPVIVEYKSTAEMQAALSSGEIDAFVHTFTEVKDGQRLIGRFAPRPFYYITYKGNDDVLRELNEAIVDLKISQPELETELMNEFFYSKFDKAVLLTTEEKKYIQENDTLVVGYVDGYYPFSYNEDGEFKGLTKEIIESGLGVAGFNLDFRMLSNRLKAYEAVQNGEIDIFAYSTDAAETLAEYGLKEVAEYAEVPLVLVMNEAGSSTDVETLATVPFLEDYARRALYNDDLDILTYETQQECIDAVTNSVVDAVLCNGYIAEHLMRTEVAYANLQVKNVFSGAYSIAMAVKDEDKVLASILKKTISPSDYKMVNEYTLRENTYPLVSFTDFIKNNSLAIIGGLILLLILVCVVVTHMLNDSKKIQKLMYKDSKIDIWNMNYFTFWGEHRLLPERRLEYAVVYVNLAQFRRYNVVYGWNAGERLLEQVASVLIKNVDADLEICARNQGDRFIMLLSYQDKNALMNRILRIKENVENQIYKETENRMALLMGIYHIPEDSSELRGAISKANQALDFAGTGKDNDIQIYDENLEVLIKERHEREKLLEAVDINKDFVAFYQPKVDIRTNAIVGAEALVRFKDPSDGGKIKAPGYFVPYYEQTGRITEIDFFVCESVCKMLRKRMDAGLPVVTVSCNFSRMHFVKDGFVERFEALLKKYKIDKELIEVEITETLVVEELQQNKVKETIDMLKGKGIRISIDDFGAGYSSLGVFEQIPASVVKMDRAFFLNKENHSRQVKIMRGIVKLTEDLDAQIVCEGVETEDDIHLMEEIGAYVAQGYYYSKPVAEDIFEEMLAG